VLLCDQCLMFQRIVLPHHQDEAVKKNEDSFEPLDPEDEIAMILLDMRNRSPNNKVPIAIGLESLVTLL